MDGQELATGPIDVENPEGYFQATETKDRASIESATRVQAKVGDRLVTLKDWHLCMQTPNTNHFHFELEK